MNICRICGNELPDNLTECPYCGSRQGDEPDNHNTGIPGRAEPQHKVRNQEISTVNIEAGMPAVAQALALLDIKISEAHLRGTGLIRVIHGWGSTGTGGRIKAALPQHLNDLKQRKIILDYLPGSQYSDTIPRGRHLLSKFPDLKTTIRPDRRNPGITLIEL